MTKHFKILSVVNEATNANPGSPLEPIAEDRNRELEHSVRYDLRIAATFPWADPKQRNALQLAIFKEFEKAARTWKAVP